MQQQYDSRFAQQPNPAASPTRQRPNRVWAIPALVLWVIVWIAALGFLLFENPSPLMPAYDKPVTCQALLDRPSALMVNSPGGHVLDVNKWEEYEIEYQLDDAEFDLALQQACDSVRTNQLAKLTVVASVGGVATVAGLLLAIPQVRREHSLR